MKIPSSMMMVAALAAAASSAQAQDAPRTILVRGDNLAGAKRQLAMGNASLKASLDLLLVQARQALAAPPLSVMEKQRTPPSGDKHDYMSMAPYWWPDSSKPGGLPFVRRDGETYPESRTDHDGVRLQKTIARVKALAYAWYFTGDVAYADAAATRLRVFFIDPATRMNPNLQFGQAVLGVTDGRGAGLIDTRALPELVDAVRILAGSSAWTTADNDAMTTWFREFLTWMRDSRIGREERAAKNNHGVFYDAQVASLALFVGDGTVAREVLGDSAKARIASQIRADGKQPLELQRTRPLHYSVFALHAFTMLAEMARHVDVDLWHYTAPSGGSIEKGLRFVAPYAGAPATFPQKDITPVEADAFVLPLRRAAAAYSDEAFARELRRLPPDVLRSHLSAFEFAGAAR